MDKPRALREHLGRRIPWIAANPDKLLLSVLSGTVFATGTLGKSFQTGFVLEVFVYEFAYPANLLLFAVLDWLRDAQPDMLQNPALMEKGYAFEAELIDGKTWDVSIKLRLTESSEVIMAGEVLQDIRYIPEPPVDPFAGQVFDEIIINPPV